MNKPDHINIKIGWYKYIDIGYVFFYKHFPKTANRQPHKKVLLPSFLGDRITKNKYGHKHELIKDILLLMPLHQRNGVVIRTPKQSTGQNKGIAYQVLNGGIGAIKGRVAIINQIRQPFYQVGEGLASLIGVNHGVNGGLTSFPEVVRVPRNQYIPHDRIMHVKLGVTEEVKVSGVGGDDLPEVLLVEL